MNLTKKQKKLLIVIIAVVIVAVVIVAVVGCSKKEEPKPEPKPAKPVATEAAIIEEPEPVIYFSPYTGLPIEDPKNVNRRPLSIKIENSPDAWPQMGLNAADIIYETRVEGGISRFNCIFQSTIPDEVGPVRSARLSDGWIVPQYDALFYYSGSNSEVSARLKSADVTFGPSDALLHRVSFKSAPHNLYMDSKGAYKAAKKKKTKRAAGLKSLYYGFERTTDGAISGSAIVPIVTGSAISEGALTSPDGEASSDAVVTSPTSETSGDATDASSEAAETSGAATEELGASAAPLPEFTGKPAESLSLDFFSPAKWEWDAEKGVWLRWTSGKEHFDGATEERVFTDNIVVLYAEYPQAKSRDPVGSPTYDTILGGEGKAMLFRDGYVYECTWKADKNTPPALYDEQGRQLPLKQGKTWFEVPPTSGMKVTVE